MQILPDAQLRDVRLVHARPHLHARGVHDLHEGKTGADLVTFLDVRHSPTLPHGTNHGHAVHGRPDQHLFRVALRPFHGGQRAITLDFKDLQFGARRLAFEVECFAELLKCGPRLVQVELVLFRVNVGDDLILFYFQLSRLLRVFGLFQFGFIGGA